MSNNAGQTSQKRSGSARQTPRKRNSSGQSPSASTLSVKKNNRKLELIIAFLLILVAALITVFLYYLKFQWYFLLIPLSVLIISLLYLGYTSASDWTGFGHYTPTKKDVQRAKTLWDWLQLLIISATLTLVVIWFNYQQNQTNIEISTKQYLQNQAIAYNQQQDTILSDYFSDMSSLLLNANENLINSKPDSNIRNIARARTLLALHRLEQGRKSNIVQFLFEAGLINRKRPILDPVINLDQADLSNINLKNIKLDGIDLNGANLINAQLQYASLKGADLSGVNLSGADLSNAILEGSTLKNANLKSAKLSYADLSHTDLSYADLENSTMYVTIFNSAILDYTDLREAYMSYANLSDAHAFLANLSLADLRYAILRDVKLRHADLNFTDLSYANLSYGNLDNADATKANLSYANLSYSCLYGLAVTHANLSDANLSYSYLVAVDLSDKNGVILKNAKLENAIRKPNGPEICS